MSYEQFWFSDPWMVKAFREAHKIRRQMRNEELWIEGIYTLKALSVALQNSFGKHPADYFKEPLRIFPKTEAEIEREKREERLKLIEYLSGMARKNKG